MILSFKVKINRLLFVPVPHIFESFGNARLLLLSSKQKDDVPLRTPS